MRSIEETPFLVRTVRQQDLAPLSDVLASSFHGQEGWMRWLYPLLKAGIYEDLRSRLLTRGPHYACLAAVRPTPQNRITPAEVGQSPQAALGLLTKQEDALLGTVEVALKTPPLLQPWSHKYVYISNLAVKAECRRQGIAQQLLYTCERVAVDWGFSDLYLHVLENNHTARRLYWKVGYRVQRIDVNPLSLMLGQPRQLFLRKQLK
ncbi:MAG: GNAT family N-acetyltransferase [Cyanobacteria bacterium RM1_2_2]|nr:GNAT family N-acetyltransferase [Cyanobacteria bacterium RM1_2_2]